MLMGQYFKIVNLDKREYLDPSCFTSGPKLESFSLSGTGALRVLARLLCTDTWGEYSGRWAGDRVLIAGDSPTRNCSPLARQPKGEILYEHIAFDADEEPANQTWRNITKATCEEFGRYYAEQGLPPLSVDPDEEG
jgi:hypothetical protein